MGDKARILKMLGAICVALFLFGTAVMLVGYQPFDVKHVATMIFVAVIAIVCFAFAKHTKN